MRRRILRHRLFWVVLLFGLALVWLTLQVLRAGEALASAARRRRLRTRSFAT
jgi:hypothetical protein